MLAVFIGIAAYAAVGLGVEGTIPADTYKLGGALIVVAIATHLIVRRVAPYADPVLLPLVIALNGLGLAMIYRLDLGRQQIDPERAAFANSQLVWTAIGIAAFAGILDAGPRPPPAADPDLHLRLCRDRPADPAAAAALRTHDQRRPHLDQLRPVQLPARRGGQGVPRDLLRGLPRGQARRPRAGRSPRHGHRPAARPRPRPDPRPAGSSASASWSSSATSARRCCSSACSS